MRRKHKNLSPWLDYFQMLHRYEREGLLQTEVAKHEAYITQSALHAITPGEDPALQVTSGAILATLHHIRTYCAWMSIQGQALAKPLLQYEREPFALHVVADVKPNDPIYTLHISLRRHWWWPFRKLEKVEAINYKED
ncbi:MAG: hypothetical protein J5732_02950 [Bacteroidaceae bacterium]|nr:hypothetical protein [Bacteroidaceae bacterium]